MTRLGVVSYTGESKKKYVFDVYNLHATWNPVGVVYLVTRADTNSNIAVTHYLLYVGQTSNLKAEFYNHPRQACFKKYNANRLCTLLQSDELTRLTIANDLIRHWQPPCNIEREPAAPGWQVEHSGLAVDAQGKTIGRLEVNGDVFTKDNIDESGEPFGFPVGNVDTAGVVTDCRRSPLGHVDTKGIIFDKDHLTIAHVTPAGIVFDAQAHFVGAVNRNLYKNYCRADWSPMIYRAAAAVLLLLDIEKLKRVPKSAPK